LLKPCQTSLGSSGGGAEVLEKGTLGFDELNVCTIVDDHLLLLERSIVGPVERGETPLFGDDNLLPAGELVSGSAEGFNDDGSVDVFASDRHDDLANVDSGNGTVGFTPSSTHTLLQPIGTGTRQHLVDPDDVVRVYPDPHVERLLSCSLDNVLVGTNTSGLEGLGGELLIFVRDEMTAEGEVVDRGLLSSEIIDSDLGLGDTTVVS